jgi:arylsulfatase A-like enzyme
MESPLSVRAVTRPLAALLAFALLAATATAATPSTPPRPPNVILIYADDLGYGDLGCYGATDIKTPHLDRLAAEGSRFTSFYVAQSVCTASRAALMTGSYANRVSMSGALNHLSPTGLHTREKLLPQVFKGRGYATAMFGKWHLGHHPQFLPRGAASTSGSASPTPTTTARSIPPPPASPRSRSTKMKT